MNRLQLLTEATKLKSGYKWPDFIWSNDKNFKVSTEPLENAITDSLTELRLTDDFEIGADYRLYFEVVVNHKSGECTVAPIAGSYFKAVSAKVPRGIPSSVIEDVIAKAVDRAAEFYESLVIEVSREIDLRDVGIEVEPGEETMTVEYTHISMKGYKVSVKHEKGIPGIAPASDVTKYGMKHLEPVGTTANNKIAEYNAKLKAVDKYVKKLFKKHGDLINAETGEVLYEYRKKGIKKLRDIGRDDIMEIVSAKPVRDFDGPADTVFLMKYKDSRGRSGTAYVAMGD